MHIPVLRDAVLENLLPGRAELSATPSQDVARVIDGTLGAGGHAAALLERGARELLGLDCDEMALALARAALARYGDRAHVVHASYADMTTEAARLGWDGVDAVLLDLGVSSMQLDTPERGFAFRSDGPLDMRFDPGGSRPTAADLVNTLDERELADLFFRYGEERDSRRLARAVVRQRPFATTRDLASAIEQAAPRRHPANRHDHHIHPATRVFQALRIAVNDELDVVAGALPQAIDLLRPGGRLAVISFHSLEDRIVKDAFRLASTDCICPPKTPICVCGHHASVRLITRKPIIADEAECVENPRSRSARLRVVEKL
ncbi:MAG: 16S rRNA (cytosine(1402)-N(4))-methyltransferase RsmH [Anaerolineae bacterium]|nr:16S rRNA (cytosine(1402)-N(4))-methyltransferase RsmH [Anaerolineae bacterium]